MDFKVNHRRTFFSLKCLVFELLLNFDANYTCGALHSSYSIYLNWSGSFSNFSYSRLVGNLLLSFPATTPPCSHLPELHTLLIKIQKIREKSQCKNTIYLRNNSRNQSKVYSNFELAGEVLLPWPISNIFKNFVEIFIWFFIIAMYI